MVSKMLSDLVSAEAHRSIWDTEVGTATFTTPGASRESFTVSTTGDQATSLLKDSAATKRFSIAIEPSLFGAEVWAYRLVSAVAVPPPPVP
jgi:hypothetical protein